MTAIAVKTRRDFRRDLCTNSAADCAGIAVWLLPQISLPQLRWNRELRSQRDLWCDCDIQISGAIDTVLQTVQETDLSPSTRHILFECYFLIIYFLLVFSHIFSLGIDWCPVSLRPWLSQNISNGKIGFHSWELKTILHILHKSSLIMWMIYCHFQGWYSNECFFFYIYFS